MSRSTAGRLDKAKIERIKAIVMTKLGANGARLTGRPSGVVIRSLSGKNVRCCVTLDGDNFLTWLLLLAYMYTCRPSCFCCYFKWYIVARPLIFFFFLVTVKLKYTVCYCRPLVDFLF